MLDWNTPDYTMKFFGLATMDELEDFIAEHDLPVRLYPNGDIESIGRDGPFGWKEARFNDHKKKHGWRPDDDDVVEAAQKRLKKEKDDEEKEAKEHTQRLKDKVKARKEAPSGRAARTGVPRT